MKTVRATALFAGLSLGLAAFAQCGPVISTFPYAEGFETDAAWTSGGLGNDWAWGTPAHPQINSAGGGTKSWCVGGLTGQFYEFDAQSWLMSPCFDFTALDNPWISFKIFWEVERTYDGMVLQYSLDEGSTWDNVGAYNDPENCLDQNWYNTNSIINLDEASPQHGWSGRQGTTSGSCQGGQGSGGWITASHCLADLANQPSVRFRFLFGSGSTCNNFDGIGIDDVFIGSAVQAQVETTVECAGQTASFTAEDPCNDPIAWDFGDPGSGSQNSASGAITAHTYADPGTYTVTMTVTGSCGPAYTETFQVIVLGLSFITTDATCGQANGSLEAVVSGSNGPFTFDWQPGGGTDALFAGLTPGDYSLAVSGTDMCGVSASASVENVGSDFAVDVTHTDVTCAGQSDGTAAVEVTTGTAVSYIWAPMQIDAATVSGLPAGLYVVTVTSDEGCDLVVNVTIAEPEPLAVAMDPELAICAGASVTLLPDVTGGTGTYTLAWDPQGPDVSPSTTTIYSVTATDANGCVSNSASTRVEVGAAITPMLSVDAPTGCVNHCAQFLPGPSGMAAYAFDYGDGGTGEEPSHCYGRPGLFDVSLTVTDELGCSGTALFPGLVEALPTPTAGFITPGTVIISDGPLRVIDASSGATAWLWDFDGADGEDSIRDPLVSFPFIDCYTLRQIVTNTFGCVDTATAEVCVENEYALFAPNAFTPNGDGFNEVFGLVTSVRSPASFVLRVFDRWGNEVFTTSDPNEGWTGEKAENGIYAWNVELRDSEQKLRKASGHVVLIR